MSDLYERAKAAMEDCRELFEEQQARIVKLEKDLSERCALYEKGCGTFERREDHMLAHIAELEAEVNRLRSDRDCEKRMRKDSDDRATELEAALSDVRGENAKLVSALYKLRAKLVDQGEPVALLVHDGEIAELATNEAQHEHLLSLPYGTKLYAGRPPAAEQAEVLKDAGEVPDGFIDDIITCAHQFADALKANNKDKIASNTLWMNRLVLDGARAAMAGGTEPK